MWFVLSAVDLFKTRNVWHCQIKFEDTNAAIAAVDCLDDSVSTTFFVKSVLYDPNCAPTGDARQADRGCFLDEIIYSPS